ncbi:MAG: hypothetical protein ABIR30_00680 [Chitinophagaceae bacterium]
MSSGSQHKMYNYEIAPPTGVWEKIAAELDEADIAHKYPSRLHSFGITPPPHVWQGITAALDEPLLVNDYAAKLAGIEVIPPVAAWANIENALNAEQATHAPFRSRIAPWIKYAAAAAVIAFLAWGSLQLFNGKTTGKEVADKEKTQSPANDSKAVQPGTGIGKNVAVEDVNASLNEAQNERALESSKKTYAKLDTRQQSKIKNAASFYFSAPEEDEYQPGLRGLGFDNIMPVESMADRYIVLMTPDGNIIRMSKKLSDLVCCVSGEEQDKNCVDQMKRWREKIGNPANMHSPGNFMDILSLVNSLQDN